MFDNFSNIEIEKAKHVVEKFKTPKSKDEVFYNFCFCILVPQSRFKTILEVVERLKKIKFYGEQISRDNLLLLIHDVRFKNRKVDYLLDFKQKFDIFYEEFKSKFETVSDTRTLREFVKGRIKGMGLKASSHLLRNLGIEDLAIVDTHILQHLDIKDKKFDYFKIEDELRYRATKTNVSLAVYDALIWSQRAKVNEEKFVY
jgi:N-glycosylase/DNA lyase